mmetsp:Transcript_39633/g.94084  ORF Transcript_39633/g.94084 Transcript_39633/m.94084 type:complete len:241 (+) Transcript_39633:188-910(+)
MPSVTTWSVLLLLLLAVPATSIPSVGRKLKAQCHMDRCGIWCGPPRPPPCGSAYRVESSSSSGRHDSRDRSVDSASERRQGSAYSSEHYSPQQPAQEPVRSSDYMAPSDDPPSKPSDDNSAGCYGNLPFGLENCLCDGAKVGEAAGLAACGRVFTECQAVAPFTLNKQVEAVQRVCDTFALDGCTSAAQSALVVNSGCGDLIRYGTSICSPAQAMSIFMASVEQQCQPLCPNCPRHPGKF